MDVVISSALGFGLLASYRHHKSAAPNFVVAILATAIDAAFMIGTAYLMARVIL